MLGLETEYAVIRSGSALAYPFDFAGFIYSLSRSVPVAVSLRNDFRYFLANGGSFSLENGASPHFQHALLEEATPECASPLQLLESHHALQDLAIESVQETYRDHSVFLAQGNHDGHGHTYGQHESYDVNLADGWALWGWRAGLSVLLPLVFAYRFFAALWILFVVFLARCENGITWLTKFARRLFSRSKDNSSTETTHEFSGAPHISQRWLVLCAKGLRFLHRPLAFLLWCNIQLWALRRYRRQLAAFFATRCIIDGSGYVDGQGRFGVSIRASHVNAMIGFGGYGKSRPIFRCDNWLRQMCMGSPFSIAGFCKLFCRCQRVEVAIGDSGVCHHSQYLRFGMTSLVMDLIDRDLITALPRLRNPISAIQHFARDWMLLAKEPDKSGFLWRATDVQRTYALQVRKMQEQDSDAPSEVKLVLQHWQSLINHLDDVEDTSEPSRDLIGRVDWITKLWLLEQLDSDSSIEARQKLDLRYHELSEEGYGQKVLSAANVQSMLRQDRIDRARQNPPSTKAAQQRGYYIREFGGVHESNGNYSTLRIDWDEIRIQGSGGRYRTIRLSKNQ